MMAGSLKDAFVEYLICVGSVECHEDFWHDWSAVECGLLDSTWNGADNIMVNMIVGCGTYKKEPHTAIIGHRCHPLTTGLNQVP